MNLNDYQWSRNPRGLHDPGDNHVRWETWHMGWIKTVFEGNEGISWGSFALEKGMTPICRIFRNAFSGVPMDDGLRGQFQAHLDVGIKWFEFYNEPNLGAEWPAGVTPNHNDIDGQIRPICDNWLAWAEFIINGGGYPGFIALAETSIDSGMTTFWIESILNYMFDNHFDRFRNIINNGMWLATHPYIFNHWYQEEPGGNPLAPRPMERVNHREPGWHFEYPYDPISQADDPGRTVWGDTPTEPHNDVYGVLGSGIAWLERLQERFGVGWLPVIGTEGGISPLPSENEPVHQVDSRYPAYNFFSHAQGTVAMFNWIADNAPGWMFGICLWRESDYYRFGNPIPALNELAAVPARFKNNIPNYPALGDAPAPYGEEVIVQQPPPETTETKEDTPEPTAVAVIPATPIPTVPTVVPGPGPIHGAPDYHFVILAPGFDVAWFVDNTGVQAYWDSFRPILMTDIEYINFLPNDRSLVVTAIGTPDLQELIDAQIARRWPNVWMDQVIITSSSELAEEFDSRARNGLRYG